MERRRAQVDRDVGDMGRIYAVTLEETLRKADEVCARAFSRECLGSYQRYRTTHVVADFRH